MSLHHSLGERNPRVQRVIFNGDCVRWHACIDGRRCQNQGSRFGNCHGLITDQESGKYAILSDILGDEDHLGDMDFKVTGTADGITACQMDIKIKGLSFDQLREALEQAREGRHHIREAMLTEISEPRDDYKDHAPRIVGLKFPDDRSAPSLAQVEKSFKRSKRTQTPPSALKM